MPRWYVYILSNASHTLYVGITTDLARRFREHQSGRYATAFTRRYNFDRLVYYEVLASETTAAAREKQIKHWPRARKVALIESVNSSWRHLLDIDVLADLLGLR